MKQGKTFAVPFRRKRQGKTYYKKRLRILSSNKPRFVARKSLKNLQISIVEYSQNGDKVIFTVSSNVLAKFGWKGDSGNLSSAYLVGLITGKKSLEKGIREAILDLGFYNSTKGSRLYAVLKGSIDAGLDIPHSKQVSQVFLVLNIL